MVSLFGVIFVIGWIWSLVRGLKVSVLCLICNFLFVPISQIIFAIYEEKLRPPLLLIAVGIAGAIIFK